MKPGDRVRINRGPHGGRFGVITDVAARRAAVEHILKPSDTRTRLLKKLEIPGGCQAVQLDPESHKSGELEVFSEGCLDIVTRPRVLAYYMGEAISPAELEELEEAGVLGQSRPSERIPLDEILTKLEISAVAASGRTTGELRKKDAGRIFDDLGPWAVGCSDDIQEHIWGTRPAEILELIRRVRRMIVRCNDAGIEVS